MLQLSVDGYGGNTEAMTQAPQPWWTAPVDQLGPQAVQPASLPAAACLPCMDSGSHCLCQLRYMNGFPGGSDGKASTCNARDLGSIPGWEDSLEKEMATHSSILAWKIPWTEEPGRLQSMGSQRVGYD